MSKTIDNELVEQAAAGDSDSTLKLIELMESTIRTFIAPNPDEIRDDLRQAAVEGILESLSTYDGTESFRTWASPRMRFNVQIERARLLFGVVIPRATIGRYHDLMTSCGDDPNKAIDRVGEFSLTRETFLSVLSALGPVGPIPADELYARHAPHEDPTDGIFVDEMLDLLDPQERMIVEMSYWDELSERAIAEKLNLTKSTVHNIKARAISRMRLHVAQEDGLDG